MSTALAEVRDRLTRIERVLQLEKPIEWLSPKEAKRYYSVKTLARFRKEGTLKAGEDYRCSGSGRKIQYRKDALERLFS